MKITVTIEIDEDDGKELDRLTRKLSVPTDRLADAVDAAGGNSRSTSGGDGMAKKMTADASPALVDLQAQVEKTNGVVNSAITFINGIPALIAAAVAAAIANGATAEQLAPVVALGDTMGANADALAQAIAANSPPPPPTPPQP